MLRIPAWTVGNPADFGTLLFDLETDPHQLSPIRDDELELRMIELLVQGMRENEAPADQFERLGLPPLGPVGAEHLLVAAQWDRVLASGANPTT